MRTWERRRYGLENVNEQTRCDNTEYTNVAQDNGLRQAVPNTLLIYLSSKSVKKLPTYGINNFPRGLYWTYLQVSCIILGFRRDGNEIFALLGSYAENICSYGRFGTTYRSDRSLRNVGNCVISKNSEDLKIRVVTFRLFQCKTFTAFYMSTTRVMLNDLHHHHNPL